MIRIPGQPPSGPERPPEGKTFPQSPMAFQKPSAGGFLKSKERSGWDWIVFIFSFQWIAAIFTSKEGTQKQALVEQLGKLFPTAKEALKQLSYEEISNLNTVLAQAPLLREYIQSAKAKEIPQIIKKVVENPGKARYAFQLFTGVQAFLNNRISKKEAQDICKWMLENAKESWLATFEELLQGDRINVLINTLKTTADQPFPQLMQDLLQDLAFEATGTGKPSTAPFALQIEKRGERLHITDPKSKETRTLDMDQSKEAQFAAIRSLREHPEVPGSLDDQKMREDWFKKGNIYALQYANQMYLSLCPREIDLDRAGFFDRKPLLQTQQIIKTQTPGQIRLGQTSPLTEETEVKAEAKGNTCVVTLTYQKIEYTLTYFLQPNESLEQLANRITADHTLEKDLLLAKSFFVKEMKTS